MRTEFEIDLKPIAIGDFTTAAITNKITDAISTRTAKKMKGSA